MKKLETKTPPAMERQVTFADLLLLIAGADEDVRDGLGSFQDMLVERVLEEMGG